MAPRPRLRRPEPCSSGTHPSGAGPELLDADADRLVDAYLNDPYLTR